MRLSGTAYSDITKHFITAEATNYLWYAKRNTIHRLSLDSPYTDVDFKISGLRTVLSVDFDRKRNILFWGDVATDRISRLKLNGCE